MVFVPSAEMASLTALAEPLPTATSTMTAATPMRMPSIVSADRRTFAVRPCQAVISVSRQVMPELPVLTSSETIWPSLIRTMRRACSATESSCVISTIVRPSVMQRVEHPHDVRAGRRIEVAGRLVGEQQRADSW